MAAERPSESPTVSYPAGSRPTGDNSATHADSPQSDVTAIPSEFTAPTERTHDPWRTMPGLETEVSSADLVSLPTDVSQAAVKAADKVFVPGYQILDEIGRGGMGVVYKAKQEGLNRLVALKMVLTGGHASDSDLARFRTEAEAVARLQHPNIIQIYDIDQCDGLPYIALEYCDGGSLARHMRGQPWPPAEAADLVITLARAVQAAHAQQIIHRDLKPGNILLKDESGKAKDEKKPEPKSSSSLTLPPSSFQLKITDFGLAKQLDSAQGHTHTGTVMGTPSYMAPEQAAGQGKTVGPAADVYSLGAILYELLTGRPPFKAATAYDTIMQVINNTPVPVQLLNPAVDRDLAAICFKCLEKTPRDRYSTAAALAEDLARYRAGEAVSVRSVNVIERLARALQQSHTEVQFAAWGRLLLIWAAIVFVTRMGTAALIAAGPPALDTWLFLVNAIQFTVIGVSFYLFRRRGLLPSGAAERLLWTVWGGYALACFALVGISRLSAGPDRVHDHLSIYPQNAVVSGLAFFILGATVWGGSYAIGLAFFGLALLIPLAPAWGPLTYGLLWTAVLTLVGLRLTRLNRAAGESQ